MSIKNPQKICWFLVVLLWNGAAARADESHHSCPDMSQHEKILNEGRQVEKQYPRGGPDRLHSLPLYPISDYIPTCDESWMLRQLQAMESVTFSMPVVSYDKKIAAISYARQYEEYGLYSTAKKLYERILSGQKVVQESDDDLSQNCIARKGLERARLSDSAKCLINDHKYAGGIEIFGQVLEKINSGDEDLRIKQNLLSPVLKDINKAVEAQSMVRGLSTEDVISAQKVKERAKDFSIRWKKELECLDMAEKLNRTAFRLEQNGEYKVAEKLYRQSLSIKEKNLGLADSATIVQTTNLARLYAAQGRKREACRIYDEALSAMRKLPNPGSELATMLENYGDMLDQMHQPERAEKIYAEARAYHEKLRNSN